MKTLMYRMREVEGPDERKVVLDFPEGLCHGALPNFLQSDVRANKDAKVGTFFR